MQKGNLSLLLGITGFWTLSIVLYSKEHDILETEFASTLIPKNPETPSGAYDVLKSTRNLQQRTSFYSYSVFHINTSIYLIKIRKQR